MASVPPVASLSDAMSDRPFALELMFHAVALRPCDGRKIRWLATTRRLRRCPYIPGGRHLFVFVCTGCGAELTAPLSQVALPVHARQKYGNGV
jgi:hypothetical protein